MRSPVPCLTAATEYGARGDAVEVLVGAEHQLARYFSCPAALHRRGVRHLLIEQLATPQNTSRTGVIRALTLETLAGWA